MAGQESGMIAFGRQTAPPLTEAVLVTSACRIKHEANPRGSDAHRAAQGRSPKSARAVEIHPSISPVVALAASAFRILSGPEVSPA
jgi:hypothetical protein